jgi:superoxide dismutase
MQLTTHGSGSPIVFGDLINSLNNSFNEVKEKLTPEQAQAFEVLNQEVVRSNNKALIENHDSFLEQLKKDKPKKTVLNTFWKEIKQLLGSAIVNSEKVAKAAEVIGKMMQD